MQKFLGGTAIEPLEKRRDKELTLGPTTLILLGLGLLALCGVCFVFGYAVGQHGSPATPAAGTLAATANAGTVPQNPGSTAKPAPTQSSFQPRQPAAAPTATNADQPAATANDSVQAAQSSPSVSQGAQGSPPPSAPVQKTAPAASVVQAALPGQSGGTQPALVSGPLVKPALPQSSAQPGTWMVQIAAVSHPEDADVLVSALRKRSYAVSVHRDPVDALIHVQVGPFATHNDAAAMRQKLLNDGYNAIVQP
jgi:cell division septation protein DedD